MYVHTKQEEEEAAGGPPLEVDEESRGGKHNAINKTKQQQKLQT